jgi:DNA-binding NarL/FixJ family response regulator
LAQVPRVLTFTAHAPVEDIACVTLAGADGYLHKDISGEELLDAVERTRAGKRVWLLPAGNEKEPRLAWRRPPTTPGSPPKTRRSSPSSSGGVPSRDRRSAVHKPLRRP